MLLSISPIVAFLLTLLVVAAIGALVGYITNEQSTLGGFVSAMIGLAVAVVLGILIWLVIVSTVTFTAPAVAVQPAQPLVQSAPAQPALDPASAAQPSGSCSASPVNPQDDVTVSLDSGFFVIEEFDNRVSPAVHKFWVYNVADQGQRFVWAIASYGMRAWKCTDASSAFTTAMNSAIGYKTEHPDHLVYGPDGYLR